MYKLIDFSRNSKLEQVNNLTFTRPSLQLSNITRTLEKWEPDLQYDFHHKRWVGLVPQPEPVEINSIQILAKFNDSGNIGFFPEHLTLYEFLKSHQIFPYAQTPSILNLFSYTGSSILPILQNEAINLTCVDSSKSSLNTFLQNLKLNQIQNSPRIIVDDCYNFTQKESRRGKSYDLILTDPPTIGRDKKGRLFKLKDLWEVHIDLLVSLLSDEENAAILFTHHTSSLDNNQVVKILADKGYAVYSETSLIEDSFGKKLDCGYRMIIKKK